MSKLKSVSGLFFVCLPTDNDTARDISLFIKVDLRHELVFIYIRNCLVNALFWGAASLACASDICGHPCSSLKSSILNMLHFYDIKWL